MKKKIILTAAIAAALVVGAAGPASALLYNTTLVSTGSQSVKVKDIYGSTFTIKPGGGAPDVNRAYVEGGKCLRIVNAQQGAPKKVCPPRTGVWVNVPGYPMGTFVLTKTG